MGAGIAGSSWLWWADSIAIAALGLTAGLVCLLNAQLAASVVAFALTAVSGSYALRCRTEYRRGWRHGYESAIRTALQYQAGKTPDVETRAAVHGDPIPEPWERHVSPIRPRSTR